MDDSRTWNAIVRYPLHDCLLSESINDTVSMDTIRYADLYSDLWS